MPIALALPFAEAAGIAVAGLSAAAIANKVSEYIKLNPEDSMTILKMINPASGGVFAGEGLSTLFKKKAKEDSDDESVEVAPEDKTREERAKEMKKRFKEGKGDKREIGKKGFEEVIKPVKDIEDLLEGEERYDGSLEDAPKPKFDYTKFFKADGGRIGYVGGGLATTQDFANALKSVSAGTTYQQQTQAKEYARNEAAQMLNEAARAKPQARGIENIYNTFFKNQNVTGIGPNTFGRSGSGTNPDALMYYRSADRDKILDAMANQMLNTTPYAAPKPIPKTYRTVSPEAQALNMSQSTYEDIIRSGADPKQYYMDYQNRIMAGNPNLLKYGQVIGGPGMGIAGPGTAPGATPPTQAQMNQMMQNNPMGYMDFADLVKTYSADPYKGLQEEIKDMVDGRDTGYMGGQDYYDINVLGLDGRGIAEKYGLQYADGGRIGKVLGFVNDGENIIGADLKKDPYEQYQDKFQEAFDISRNYPSNSLGPFGEQGMSSDMRHQLGASGGKDTIIDYLSNFGINPQGKFADRVGNLGIGVATALTEIPDAFKMASEAMKRKDIDALTSGKFLTQPLEDVRSNFAAMNIPYGLTTQEKENLILSNYPGYVPNITTPNYSYGTAAAADFQDGQILQPNVVPERIAPATYYNSAPNFNADVLREEEDAQYNLPKTNGIINSLLNMKSTVPQMLLSAATKVPGAGLVLGGLSSLSNLIGNSFENRQLTGEGVIVDEFGRSYDADELNAQNALGGYYTDAARSSRRRDSRIQNMLARQAAGKMISQNNLIALQEQAAREQAARETATAALAAQNASTYGTSGATGGYQSSWGGVDSFMSGSGTAADMGSFADGGLISLFVETK
jgi:hypothetical protein